MKRKIDLMIAILCLALIMILCYDMGTGRAWPWVAVLTLLGLIHLVMGLTSEKKNKENTPRQVAGEKPIPEAACTELVLLSEEGSHLASWNIYGKNGIVIGRDVGENQVTVDLNETTYASLIDVEHAINIGGGKIYMN